MTDWFTPEQRSRNMASIRSRGNKTTELRLVRLLRRAHVTGWRRRQNLPGWPDFTFRAQRMGIFVDGCFWHGCPRCYRLPEDNRSYWMEKVQTNRRRDRRNTRTLRLRGWRVLRIWEHLLISESGLRGVTARVKRAVGRTASRHQF